MKSQLTNDQITDVMKSRGITRKSAVQFLSRDRKTGGTKAAVAPAKDVKMAAANDKTLPVFGPTPTKAKAPKPEVPQTDAGAARAEGMRLYKLAGRPSQADVKKVFGTLKAIGWTWAHRAKVMELATAEEAALKFQKVLASK